MTALRKATEVGMKPDQLTQDLAMIARNAINYIIKLERERDALKQTLHDELDGNLRLRDLGGARPDEPMLTFLERIIAERDALLEALRDALSVCASVSISHDRRIKRDGSVLYAQTEEWCRWVEDEVGPKLRAAIKAVEEGK